MIRRRLPWVAVLATLATAVVVLFGPLWSTSVGENPMHRSSRPDWEAIVALATPTVLVLSSALVAVLGPRRPLWAGVVLALGAWVLLAPPLGAASSTLITWFAPALLLTLAAWLWGLSPARRT